MAAAAGYTPQSDQCLRNMTPGSSGDSAPSLPLCPPVLLEISNRVDVSRTVDLTQPQGVCQAIDGILTSHLAASQGRDLLARAIDDVARAFRGDLPGFLRCDTQYHDLRHAFDSALAMARLINGYRQADPAEVPAQMDADHGLLGVLLALFHDIGLLRRADEGHLQGAQLTAVHERRSVSFARDWLLRTPLAYLADKAELIMVTRLEAPFPAHLGPLDHALACLLGTADILSQLSDRCYLEKCRDFLFEEFRVMGLAGTRESNFPTPEELLRKTPEFILGPVNQRLREEYEGMQRMMKIHFNGDCLYAEAIERNFRYLEKVLDSDAFYLLRRLPERLVDAG